MIAERWAMCPEEDLPPGLHPLTVRQREVIDAYLALHNRFGKPPTLRDLMKVFGIRSPNGIMCHLNVLVRKGWMRGQKMESRGFLLTAAAYAFLHREAKAAWPEGGDVAMSLPPGGRLSPEGAVRLAQSLLAAADAVKAVTP